MALPHYIRKFLYASSPISHDVVFGAVAGMAGQLGPQVDPPPSLAHALLTLFDSPRCHRAFRMLVFLVGLFEHHAQLLGLIMVLYQRSRFSIFGAPESPAP